MAVSPETFQPKLASSEQARAAGKDIAELHPVSSGTSLSLDRQADTESETADRPHSSPDGKLLRTCGTGPELIQVLKYRDEDVRTITTDPWLLDGTFSVSSHRLPSVLVCLGPDVSFL